MNRWFWMAGVLFLLMGFQAGMAQQHPAPQTETPHKAGAFRFPMPEFESGYKHPAQTMPVPVKIPAWVDVSLLVLALSATAWSVLRLRSRRAVFVIALCSLLYFGFYRKGCVCSVGALQNVVNAFFDRSFAVPVVVAVFFLLPILFALYFGRVFCAGVCPLGAIQEMAAIRPVQVAPPVDAMLGLLPYAYLGLAVVCMATQSGFIICRYDPFVGFFRQNASFNMLLAGGLLLVAGIFIARPYCRYLCPYGVLLRWASRFSKWHAAITPRECIQCRLCEDSCPYNAIVIPPSQEVSEDRRSGIRRLSRLIGIAPLIVLSGLGTGFLVHPFMAKLNPTVRLAERIAAEERGAVSAHTIESDAYRAGEKTLDALYADAAHVVNRFRYASTLFGGFMGLVISMKLIRLSLVRKSKDYVPDRGACLSCARCYSYCPVEASHENK